MVYGNLKENGRCVVQVKYRMNVYGPDRVVGVKNVERIWANIVQEIGKT